MQRVDGIGGVFFKARDPDTLRAWYRRHLGLDIQEWGGLAFPPTPASANADALSAHTTWCVFPGDTSYFGSGGAPFMINYRVSDLDGLLVLLRAEGCEVDAKTDASEYGKFGWVTDPEGNRIELWQPPA
jgi:catechol 2,3-dioxygenase-like lactoylglutathione lyase family enzyme